VFLFESRLDATTTDLDFSIYMLPDSGKFRDLVVGKPRRPRRRARTAGGDRRHREHRDPVRVAVDVRVAGEAGLRERRRQHRDDDGPRHERRREPTPIRPLADVPAEVGVEPHAGTVFELQGEPSGYLAILFEEESAAKIAASMLPSEPDEPLGGMAENALCELGNVMTSGFIDGWANVLGTSITHSPPEFVHDIGSAAISPLVAKLSRRQTTGS